MHSFSSRLSKNGSFLRQDLSICNMGITWTAEMLGTGVFAKCIGKINQFMVDLSERHKVLLKPGLSTGSNHPKIN